MRSRQNDLTSVGFSRTIQFDMPIFDLPKGWVAK